MSLLKTLATILLFLGMVSCAPLNNTTMALTETTTPTPSSIKTTTIYFVKQPVNPVQVTYHCYNGTVDHTYVGQNLNSWGGDATPGHIRQILFMDKAPNCTTAMTIRSTGQERLFISRDDFWYELGDEYYAYYNSTITCNGCSFTSDNVTVYPGRHLYMQRTQLIHFYNVSRGYWGNPLFV